MLFLLPNYFHAPRRVVATARRNPKGAIHVKTHLPRIIIAYICIYIHTKTGLFISFFFSIRLRLSLSNTCTHIYAYNFFLGQLLGPRFRRVTPKRAHYRTPVRYLPPPLPIKEKYGTRIFEYVSIRVTHIISLYSTIYRIILVYMYVYDVYIYTLFGENT